MRFCTSGAFHSNLPNKSAERCSSARMLSSVGLSGSPIISADVAAIHCSNFGLLSTTSFSPLNEAAKSRASGAKEAQFPFHFRLRGSLRLINSYLAEKPEKLFLLRVKL